MAKDRNALRAGVFIVASIALIVAVIYEVRGGAGFGETQKRRVIFALTDDISGLRVGDNVRIGGYTVGAVQSIDLDQPADPKVAPRIVVVVTLPAKYILREGSQLQAQSTFTGDPSLNFVSLGTGAALGPHAEVAGSPSAFSQLLASASSITPMIKDVLKTVDDKTLPGVNNDVAKLGDTAAEFKALAANLHEKIDPAFAKYHTLADSATTFLNNTDGAVSELRKETIPNVASVTGTLKDKLPALLDNATTFLAKGKTSLDGADKVLTEVLGTFQNAKVLTGDVKDVVATNKSRLSGIILSLKAASDNLKYATIEIRHSPWRLLYKPSEGEVQNLDLYDTTRQFAEGAGALRDAAQAVDDATKSKDVAPADMKALLDSLQNSFDKFQTVEKKLYDGVK